MRRKFELLCAAFRTKPHFSDETIEEIILAIKRYLYEALEAKESKRAEATIFALCEVTALAIENHPAAIEALGPSLHVLQCKILPQLLKSGNKVATAKSIQQGALVVMDRCHSINLSEVNTIDPSLYKTLVRCCLKYGLQQTSNEDNSKAVKLSLLVVRKLLTGLENQSIYFSKANASFQLPVASQVFQMLTTHSRFETALQDQHFGVEIIRLLDTCIRLSPDDACMKAKLWKTVFSVCSAGLGHFDTAVRKLLLTQLKVNAEVSAYLGIWVFVVLFSLVLPSVRSVHG